jgi:hypothetical protein
MIVDAPRRMLLAMRNRARRPANAVPALEPHDRPNERKAPSFFESLEQLFAHQARLMFRDLE